MLQNTVYSFKISHKTHLETSGILSTCSILNLTIYSQNQILDSPL
jgi:hypothetical protein